MAGSGQAEILVIPALKTKITYYNHWNGTTNSVPGARMDLYTSGNAFRGTIYADSKGYANWGTIDAGYYYIKATAADGAGITLQYSSGQTWIFQSPTFYYNEVSSYTYTYAIPTTNDQDHIWSTFEYVVWEKNWFMNHVPDWYPSGITIFTPSTGWAWYQNVFRIEMYITTDSLSSADYMNPANSMHEYAHHLMYWGRGGMPLISGPNPHYPDSEAQPGSGHNWQFSYIEGWAEFMPCAVTNDPTMTKGWGSLEDAIYADGPWGHGNSGDWDGWDVEGANAAIWWDLLDGTNTNDHPQRPGFLFGDLLQKPFSVTWDIVAVHRPSDMWGFYGQFVSHFPGSESTQFYYICYNSLADRNNNYDT